MLHLNNGKQLNIRAQNQGIKNVHVKGIEVNGNGLGELSLTHDQLMAGGEIVFRMGAR